MPKVYWLCLVIVFFLLGLTSSINRQYNSAQIESSVGYFKSASREFAESTAELQAAISLINSQDQASITNARKALKNSRIHYKKIGAFLEYFFKYAAVAYNAPAKIEIEEPTLEINEAAGLQQIEALLFEENIAAHKEALLQQAEFIHSSATDLHALLHNFKGQDNQLLESVRLEFVRIITLGITGFDAPLLKSGLEESEAALAVMEITLQPYLTIRNKTTDNIQYYLKGARQYLRLNQNFDKFDRLYFLTEFVLPLQQQLSRFITEQGLELNTVSALNYKADNLFSPDALSMAGFPDTKVEQSAPVIKLGKTLFSENALSGDNTRSCVTCHNPDKYFTDGLPKSLAVKPHGLVPRNAPGLFYAGLQQTQFWDGRVTSLKDQVKEVISSPVEMNGKPAEIIDWLRKQESYTKLFREAFPLEKDSLISLNTISNALAAFIINLKPYNSPFDKYMQGNKEALSADQVKGFNLFMGKAQCGTCHFAPLFNGLFPPYYEISEVEVLGVTTSENFTKPQADSDGGRYNLYPVAVYKSAFKTPTLRNVAQTGPYMHNGAFSSLEKVMEFYNKGGGSGLGIKIENQTLSPQPLNLSETEVKSIISFLKALTDDPMQEQAFFLTSPKNKK